MKLFKPMDEPLINRAKNEAYRILSGVKLSYLLQYYGMINLYLYCWSQTGEKARVSKQGFLQAEKNMVTYPVERIPEYLKEHWDVTPNRNTVYIRLREMESFGLIKRENRHWENPANRNNRQGKIWLRINWMLIFAYVIEEILQTEYGYELHPHHIEGLVTVQNGNGYKKVTKIPCAHTMPKHRAMSVVALYNVIFKGVDTWRRYERQFAISKASKKFRDACNKTISNLGIDKLRGSLMATYGLNNFQASLQLSL